MVVVVVAAAVVVVVGERTGERGNESEVSVY